MYNFLKLLCSFLIISNIGCSKFTNYSDDVYIERYSSNKEKFKDLVSRVKIVSDSVFLHDSSKSKEATVYHKSLIWYDKHDKRLNKKTRLLSKELDISKITQYSDSSIAFEYSFWHDKYLIYYMQVNQTLLCRVSIHMK